MLLMMALKLHRKRGALQCIRRFPNLNLFLKRSDMLILVIPQLSPSSPISRSRNKLALQAENLDIQEDTEEGDGRAAVRASGFSI